MTDTLPALPKWWPKFRDTGPESEEVKALSDQFHVTLQAAVSKVAAASSSAKSTEKILADLTAMLERKIDDSWSWKDAYSIEQQVVLLYDEHSLDTELSRRTLEAKNLLDEDLAHWYRDSAARASSAAEKRTLLLRLVNDLQWRYTVNEAKRGYVKQITRRTGGIFITAIVLFLACVVNLELVGKLFGNNTRSLLVLAAIAGLWGAAFSMLASLKSRLEASGFNDLKVARSIALLLARVLVGTGAAAILYFFFEANLLSGSAFPALAEITNQTDATEVDLRNLALLIVWCFLAGFSEQLVPAILAKAEGRLTEHPSPMPHPSPKWSSPVSAEVLKERARAATNGAQPATAEVDAPERSSQS